jgi:hypothetical protein
MFYIYDLILIRQASFGNYMQVKNSHWAKATNNLANLSASDLYYTAKEFYDRKNGVPRQWPAHEHEPPEEEPLQ